MAENDKLVRYDTVPTALPLTVLPTWAQTTTKPAVYWATLFSGTGVNTSVIFNTSTSTYALTSGHCFVDSSVMLTVSLPSTSYGKLNYVFFLQARAGLKIAAGGQTVYYPGGSSTSTFTYTSYSTFAILAAVAANTWVLMGLKPLS